MAKNYDQGLLIVAIIGIAAVISLVVLVMNSDSTGVALSDEDLAGMAYGGGSSRSGSFGSFIGWYFCGCAGYEKFCSDTCPEGYFCYLTGCGKNEDGTCDGGVCKIQDLDEEGPKESLGPYPVD